MAVALITAGIVILADVGATLLWQEPASSLYASVRQHSAASASAAIVLIGEVREIADGNVINERQVFARHSPAHQIIAVLK